MRLHKVAILAEQVSKLHADLCDANCRITQLQREIDCGGKHKWQFLKTQDHLVFGEQVFVFKCRECDKVRKRMERYLTPEERAALITLGYPVANVGDEIE